ERTAPGIVFGRVAYLAPEQARGEQADARTDIYSTGVILWELITGTPVIEPGTETTKGLEMARRPRIPLPSERVPGAPAGIDAVTMRALNVDRSGRYASADEFCQALSEQLARFQPATDSFRVASFLRQLFGDEIEREAAERERLLREELPRLRSQSSSVRLNLSPQKEPPPDTLTLPPDRSGRMS